jgi:thiol:disulfide interchange protein
METLRRWLALPMLLTAVALVWLLGRQVGSNGWLIGAAVLALTFAFGWWGGRRQRVDEPLSPALIAMAALIVPASLLLPTGGGTTQQVAGAARAEQTGQPWSPAAEAAAIAGGRPTLVYFTADWCVSCKVNEAAAIDREQTRAAFAARGVQVLVGDWTRADPAITRKLAQHGRNSVPLYLWYPAGATDPEILPQLLTPAMLIDRANAS